jgi:hypothetical protein
MVPAQEATCPVTAVVSMGRRNTGPKSNLQVFQWLNYLAYIAVDPFFDSLRGDHQFSLLLNRISAPEPI